jgi:TnpA family transposase
MSSAHWDDILRLVASLKAGTVLPSAMLRRLAAFQGQNQLDLALQELGRIERSLFMLDWLESPQLRQHCQAGLNKSEQRHALAQVICTFKQGRIADRGHDAQQFRASGLNLVIAAIVYWNSTYIADAIAHLRDRGQPVPESAARAYLAAELGAHRLLRRFPVGSSRRYRRSASATQFLTPKSRR